MGLFAGFAIGVVDEIDCGSVIEAFWADVFSLKGATLFLRPERFGGVTGSQGKPRRYIR